MSYTSFLRWRLASPRARRVHQHHHPLLPRFHRVTGLHRAPHRCNRDRRHRCCPHHYPHLSCCRCHRLESTLLNERVGRRALESARVSGAEMVGDGGGENQPPQPAPLLTREMRGGGGHPAVPSKRVSTWGAEQQEHR